MLWCHKIWDIEICSKAYIRYGMWAIQWDNAGVEIEDCPTAASTRYFKSP